MRNQGCWWGTTRDIAEKLLQKRSRSSLQELGNERLVKCILMVMMYAGNAVKVLAEL